MNWKKFWLVAFLVFVAYFATNMLIHVVILGDEYMKPDIQQAMRPEGEMNAYFWVRIVTMAVFAFFFTFIFAKGYERKGIIEGMRFGIYITLFYFVVTSFEQFMIYPIPYRVVRYWIAAGFVQSVIMGIIAALVYKPKKTP
jgi:ABC-type multidrug transport system permease subunit